MSKIKQNMFLMVSLLLVILISSSIVAIVGFSKPQTVEAMSLTEVQLQQRRKNPGLYYTDTTTMVSDSSWSQLISSGQITISNGSLKVNAKNLAGDLVCGKVEGLTDLRFAFSSNSLLTSIDLTNIDASNVTSMENMFKDCSLLTSLDLTNFDTSKVTSMSSMFEGCSSLTSLQLGHRTKSVTDMSYMFEGCSALTSLDLKNFDTSKVANMSSMFKDCSSLTLLNLRSFDTINVTSMSSMFEDCSSLTSLNTSTFNTYNVTEMWSMFKNCSKLTSLDLSNYNTCKVMNIESMFEGCSSLISLNVSNFNTINVIYMSNMFASCSKLTSLDISKFDTSNVVEMQSMFENCSSLTSLNISNFDTNNVTDMQYIFSGCSFKELNLGNQFVIKSDCNFNGMFSRMLAYDLSSTQKQQLLALTTPESRVEKLCEFLNVSLNDLTMKEYNDYIQQCSYYPIGTIIAPSVEYGVKITLISSAGTHYALANDKATAIAELSPVTNGKILKLYYDETNKEVFSENEETPKNALTIDSTTLIIILVATGVVLISILSAVIIAIRKHKYRKY